MFSPYTICAYITIWPRFGTGKIAEIENELTSKMIMLLKFCINFKQKKLANLLKIHGVPCF